MVIRARNLGHNGGIYVYRLHNDKTNRLCANGFSALSNYLGAVFDSCPDDYFLSGPRGSTLKFRTYHDIARVTGHEVSMLARYGIKENFLRFRDNHSKVQVFMLENDDKTIAMEVPIWLSADEFHGYRELFGTELPLTGHIDVLRLEDDAIWVWDYKPNAHKEKFASTQVYFYALMLSKRTGIPLQSFRCGYFDENYSYMFNPAKSSVARGQVSLLR